MAGALPAILIAGVIGAGLVGGPIFAITKNRQFALIAGISGSLMLAALATAKLL